MAEQKLVSHLRKELGEADIDTLCEEYFMKELVAVSKLDKDRQHKFFSANDCANSARASYDNCDYERARPLLQDALERYIAAIGEASPSTSGTREKLGVISLADGEPNQALVYFMKNVESNRAQLGSKHPVYAHSLLNAGLAYFEAKTFNEAAPYFREALSIYRKLGGIHRIEYLDTLEALCWIAIEEQKLPEAEAMCESAIAILEIERPTSAVTGGYLLNWANINIEYRDYDKAEEYLRRAIAIYEDSLPQRSVTLKRARERFVWLLKKQEKLEEAGKIEQRMEAASE